MWTTSPFQRSLGEVVLQLELDNINSWAFANDMKLNPGKCK